VTSDAVAKRAGDVRDARLFYPATEKWAYFNTAAVGLASRPVADAYPFVSEWTTDGLDFVRGEAVAENARSSVAALMGADRADIALIPSVSAAAGLVAAQLGQATGAENVVIGEQEYSSNHFPWRQLSARGGSCRRPRRGSTTRSAGWPRWETRPHSRPSTSSARTRSTAGTPSSPGFSDQPRRAGWPPVELPDTNQSSIVSVPLDGRDPSLVVAALKDRRIVCAARDGNLRVAIHFYNHEDDIDRLALALAEIR